MDTFYRITWVDGVAHVQARRRGQLWRDAPILRPATPTDMAAMSDGRIEYDPATEPSSLAWAEHVRQGGD